MFEKLYQTLTLVFDHVSKHLELSLKNSAVRHFSTSVLSVWKHDQTLMLVFDTLLPQSKINARLESHGRIVHKDSTTTGNPSCMRDLKAYMCETKPILLHCSKCVHPAY